MCDLNFYQELGHSLGKVGCSLHGLSILGFFEWSDVLYGQSSPVAWHPVSQLFFVNRGYDLHS